MATKAPATMASSNTERPTSLDGVKRFPKSGISVLIIGAGVGGLQAALECWRKGCEVLVVERAEKLSSLGDYFTVTPSALTTLKDFPSMHADYQKCVYNCSIHAYSPSGDPIWSGDPEWRRPGVTNAAPDVTAHRLGIPIHWNERVVSVEEADDSVTVRTASGKQFTCDVCIGAYGIGSAIPGFHTGPDIAVQDSGYAVARLAFPRSAIRDDAPAASLLQNIDVRPEFRTYVGNDIHIILFLTPDWVAFAFTHPDYSNAQESWSNFKEPADLIPYLEKAGSDWDPAVLDFVRAAPTAVVDWKLRWRDSSSQWASDRGRLIRLGDAAHAFFPTAGNGAVQALEDAVSLAECLRLAGKQGVCQATKVHNKLRFERVTILHPMCEFVQPMNAPWPSHT